MGTAAGSAEDRRVFVADAAPRADGSWIVAIPTLGVVVGCGGAGCTGGELRALVARLLEEPLERVDVRMRRRDGAGAR